MALLFCALALGASIAAGVSVPACKSDSGSDVDFAYAFKYPKGWEYAYMDSSHKLAKSSHTLTSSSSSISKTLAQLHNDDFSYVLWSGQPPAGHSAGSSPSAHAKGALIFTSAGGLWLTHSLPHFPAMPNSSSVNLWGEAASDFGQSFLCITLTPAELHKLSPVMAINRPVVYDNMFASGDTKTFADIMDWAVNKKHDATAMTTEVTITSKGGQSFDVFGKSGKWGKGKDLYHDLVAPQMGALEMEGWRRGAGVWNAACSGKQVYDILAVSFPGRDWNTGSDHSKWAVSKSGSVFCVGDINRADGQDKRGGGTVCIQDASFANQMREVISTIDKCTKTGIVLV